jgi:hypothetical protein
MLRKPLKPGDKIEYWLSDQEDGMCTVIAVRPYTGRYPEFFIQIVTLTAPRTKKGEMEIAW